MRVNVHRHANLAMSQHFGQVTIEECALGVEGYWKNYSAPVLSQGATPTPAHLDSTFFTWRGQTVKLSPAPGGYFVYPLHSHSRYYHAGHYTGMTANLDAHLTLHRIGRGAQFIKAIEEAGISFEVVRLWKCETWEEARALEKALKARHDGARNCPVCQGKPLDTLTSLRRGHHPAVSRPQGKRRPMGKSRPAFVRR